MEREPEAVSPSSGKSPSNDNTGIELVSKDVEGLLWPAFLLLLDLRAGCLLQRTSDDGDAFHPFLAVVSSASVRKVSS